MDAHEVTADSRRQPTKRLLLALTLVVALTLAGTLVAGAVVGEDDGSLERDGHNLSVDLSGIDGDPDELIVEVNEPAGITYTENASGETGDIDVDLTEPDEPIGNESLTAANVTVTVTLADDEPETVARNEIIGLHYVTFDEPVPVWIADGEVRIALADDGTDGLVGNETVQIAADESGDTIDGTIRNGGTQLAIDHDEFVEHVSATDEFTIDIYENGGAVTESHRSLGPELRSVDDQLVVWHPLLETDREYDINAEDADGRYVATDSPLEPGTLALSTLSLGDDLFVAISGTDGDELHFEIENVTAIDPIELNATIVDDSTLEFEQGVAGLDVRNAVLASNDTRQFDIDGAIDENGRLDLGNETVTADDELLLATGAGIASVELEKIESETESTGTFSAVLSHSGYGIAIVLPFVFGVVVGIIGTRIGGYPTRKKLGVATALGFGVVLTIVASILWLRTTGFWPLEQTEPSRYGLIGGGVLGIALVPTTYAVLGPRIAGSSPAFSATVTVTDGNQPLQGETTVHYRNAADEDFGGTKTITDGKGAITIPERGTWELAAKHGSETSDLVTVTSRRSSATLTIPFSSTITVTDQRAEPIPGASITTDDETVETDTAGTATLSPPDDASSIDVAVDHEKYRPETVTVEFGKRSNQRITLTPRTGRVELVSQIDGVRTGATRLQLTPARTEQYLQRRSAGTTVTTGADGVATVDGVMIGTYRVESSMSPGAASPFDGATSSLTVTEDGTASATLETRFTWSLSREQRKRIDEIRQDIRSLSSYSGRDTSIPQYYGSVIESMLETVESMPDAGHHFMAFDDEPDAVANAILDSASRTVEAINEAMTTKRNADLFAACADMPDPGIDWRGEYSLSKLLERLESDPGTQRKAVKERYKEVGARIEAQRRDVSEIAPAQEMHQCAWDLIGETDRGRDAIVIGYTSLLLLDAVEQLFEHDALTERLSRTVF